ncbi:peptidyl-prolyl cis-trans isomerase [Winogradskyella ursingii]|uniref:peptidyl-prolyl cis-trans isomerase n=1 Tax=Winogradskyella ursingii TaxID=2686079 RepID=UPI001FE9F5DC|nr:peptidyl-prolyl cis-trans isomerase [Winogradskyella ursingii]
MKYSLYIIFLLLAVTSCDLFRPADDRRPIARVNDIYLYEEDIESIVPENATEQDSALLVNAYINRWAKQLLLMEGAKVNLSEEQQKEFSRLVSQYKTDLYSRAYMDGLVNKNIDTLVAESEAQIFYEANKESFKLNDNLLQFRYISLPQNTIRLDTIEKRFKRFEQKDQRYLDSISVQFRSYSLNDSVWIKTSQVLDKIPVLNAENKDQLLKKSNFLRLKDSLNLYLVQVKDVRMQNDYAPLEYVKSSIKQIVINKRKLELIKQLENDITKDAIENNQFQTYN